MKSCLYEGQIVHRRLQPKPHRFRVGLYMCYLDLAELPDLFDGHWLWSARRPAPNWFRRADYLDPETESLDTAVRDRMEQSLGRRPRGPIRLLTHLRTLGYVFNPVSFYYAFDESDTRVESVLAEITNTPWNERHAYAAPWSEDGRMRFSKQFHVSPFMPMDQEYHWSMGQPGSGLWVHMENHRAGEKVFEADLAFRRTEISRASLTRVLVRYPAMTLRIIAGIHFQALRLWTKSVPFHSHPAKLSQS